MGDRDRRASWAGDVWLPSRIAGGRSSGIGVSRLEFSRRVASPDVTGGDVTVDDVHH